jgi:hypothetical protein
MNQLSERGRPTQGGPRSDLGERWGPWSTLSQSDVHWPQLKHLVVVGHDKPLSYRRRQCLFGQIDEAWTILSSLGLIPVGRG